MRSKKEEFSVWPLMIDMLTSILIIYLLFNFFDSMMNPKDMEQVLIDLKRQSFIQEFDRRFAPEIGRKDIVREAKFDYLQLTFSKQILFTQGEHTLNPAGKNTLRKLSTLFFQESKKENIKYIQVEGHTDNTPQQSLSYPRDNWELSSARAISVVKYLLELQVPERFFSANGYGPNVPLGIDRSLNRRVEIKIYFSSN